MYSADRAAATTCSPSCTGESTHCPSLWLPPGFPAAEREYISRHSALEGLPGHSTCACPAKVNPSILADERYQYLFSVEVVNELVLQGVCPFGKPTGK